MQKFIFAIRSRGFFLLVIAFFIISGLVYAEVTEQFDRASILHFQFTLTGDYKSNIRNTERLGRTIILYDELKDMLDRAEYKENAKKM